jgi:hypothetical protein
LSPFSNVSIFQSSHNICEVCIKSRGKKYYNTNVNNSVNNSLSIANTLANTLANTIDISSSVKEISTQGSDSSSHNVAAMPPPADKRAGPKSVKAKWAQENQSQSSPNIDESGTSTQCTENLMQANVSSNA